MAEHLKVVFFGDPNHEYSNRAGDHLMRQPELEVAGVVAATTKPAANKLGQRWSGRMRAIRDRVVGREYWPGFAQTAEASSVAVWRAHRGTPSDFVDWLRAQGADLLVCVAYPYLLKQSVYGLPRLGTIGVYPSLLPASRGFHPVFWALRNGERSIGATAFRLDDGIDTGPIIAQSPVPVLPGDTFWRAYSRVIATTPQLLARVLELARSGDLAGVPQDPSAGSYYSIPRLSHYPLYFWRVVTGSLRVAHGA